MTFGWSEGKAFPFLIEKQGRFPVKPGMTIGAFY
jgi:hypothetical protein